MSTTSHPLALISQEDRDRAIGSIVFPDKPHHYFLPETLPFPPGTIINYSQFFEKVDPSLRQGSYVPPEELRNGDVLQFSDYRGVSTYYVLWLAKNLISFTQDQHNKLFHPAKKPDYHRDHDFSKKEIRCSVLPIDFQVPFMPNPVPVASPESEGSYPIVRPREENGVHNDHLHECYVFCHVDEYGYLGTTATSMGSPGYFAAVKTDSPCQTLLDPLLVHSDSYYGRLIGYAKQSRDALRASPFFPSDFIGKLATPSAPRPRAGAEGAAEEEDTPQARYEQHLKQIDFIPIDIARSECTGGCASRGAHPFYEVRNLLYRHFLLFLGISSPPVNLPVMNAAYEDCADTLISFFVSHSTTITFYQGVHDSLPCLSLMRPSDLYCERSQGELTKHLNAEDDDYIQKYNEIVSGVYKKWSELDSSSRKSFDEETARENALREEANRQIGAYRLFVEEKRIEALQALTSNQSTALSWFEFESSLVERWRASTTEEKAEFFRRNEAKEADQQLASDIERIVQHISLQDTMDRTHRLMEQAPGINPVAASANVMAAAMIAEHNPGHPQAAPPQTQTQTLPVTERIVPSAINFFEIRKSTNSNISNHGILFSSRMGGSGYRPSKGFVMFVLQQYADLQRNQNVYNTEAYRDLVRRWKALTEEEKAALATEEDVISERNQEYQRQRLEKIRKVREANAPPPGSFGFGRPAAPPAPSVGFPAATPAPVTGAAPPANQPTDKKN